MDAGALGRVAAAHATLVDAAAAHVVTSKALDSALGRLLEPTVRPALKEALPAFVGEPVRPGFLARMRGAASAPAEAKAEARAAAEAGPTGLELLSGDVAGLPDAVRGPALEALSDLRAATYAHRNTHAPLIQARKAALEAIDALRLPEAETRGLKSRLSDVRPVSTTSGAFERPKPYSDGRQVWQQDLRTVVDGWSADMRAHLGGASPRVSLPEPQWSEAYSKYGNLYHMESGAPSLAETLGIVRTEVDADLGRLSGLADGSAHDLTRIANTLADATSGPARAAKAFDQAAVTRYHEIAGAAKDAGAADRGSFEGRMSSVIG
ncbi:MAG: hypothetical protein JWM98_3310 [Thermoleophilia bacterium]|nr:hypothetical protein [Thermoleophilia bacterium]